MYHLGVENENKAIKHLKNDMIRDYTEKQINRMYRETKKFIEMSRDPYCASCGATGVILDPSHLISRDHCKKFGCIPLICDEKNIQLHCRTCHQHWENGTKKGADFDENMTYILYLKDQNIIPNELYQKHLNRWQH